MPCPAPANLTDGVVTLSPTPVLDDNATHHCNPGFYLIGNDIRTCVAKGPGLVDWEPAVPTCNSKIVFLV